MNSKTTNPAAVGARGALEMFNSRATENSPENRPNALNTQEIRAAWIARRARISPDIASVVAGLAFGPEGAR